MSVNLGLPAYRRDKLDHTSTPGASSNEPPRPTELKHLSDTYGRTATDLRISLTDQCNLRCTYCMPAEGLQWLEKTSVMQREEIKRLTTIAITQLGVRTIRFTGGEPLLRHDIQDIIADTRSIPSADHIDIALTTNAIGLAQRIQGLVTAGLDRINVSLDTIDADTFTTITRRPFLNRVIAGIEAAHEALPAKPATGHRAPIKINAVLMPGINDTQAPDLLEWALQHNYQLRFIEHMPLDADHTWQRNTMLTAADIRTALSTKFTLTPDTEPRDGAPAELFNVTRNGIALGSVGIIASVTENFCAACTRTRLTAEGRVRNCLFATRETDLLTPLRNGASDSELADLWRNAMWGKQAGHGVNQANFTQPERPMSAIGG